MLEQLSTSTNEQDKDILNDVYIRWPVDLERSLMEGSYTKAWRAKSRAPRKEYEVLAEGLMGTIRYVILDVHYCKSFNRFASITYPLDLALTNDL
jgi:26S proteasome regulatory subunit N12